MRSIATAIVLWFAITLQLVGKPHVSPPDYQQTANTQAAQAATLQNDQAAATHTDHADKSMPPWYASPEWWLVGVGILTLIGIYYQAAKTAGAAKAAADSVEAINRQAGILERQTKATEKASEAAKASAEAAQANINIIISKERARIMVTAWHLDLTPAANGLCSVRYDVIYSGQSPAFIIDSGVWADAVDSEDAKTFPLWMAIRELPPIAPINRDIIHCETWIDLKPDAVRKVNEGTTFVRVYGFVRYRDVFDIQRTTTFRYLWRPPSLYGIPGITNGGWIKVGAPGDNAEI
jgi:hypothetical protein